MCIFIQPYLAFTASAASDRALFLTLSAVLDASEKAAPRICWPPRSGLSEKGEELIQEFFTTQFSLGSFPGRVDVELGAAVLAVRIRSWPPSIDIRHRMCALPDALYPPGCGYGRGCCYKDAEANVAVNAC